MVFFVQLDRASVTILRVGMILGLYPVVQNSSRVVFGLLS